MERETLIGMRRFDVADPCGMASSEHLSLTKLPGRSRQTFFCASGVGFGGKGGGVKVEREMFAIHISETNCCQFRGVTRHGDEVSRPHEDPPASEQPLPTVFGFSVLGVEV